jgi:hypothetical protein
MHSMQDFNAADHTPGMLVSVPVFGPFRHVGLLGDRWIGGNLTVISCSRRRGEVVEESWDEFRQGQLVTLENYLGSRSPEVVLARAREAIGTRWNLVTFNCEHFVRRAHGVREQSPQLQAAMLFVCGALVMASALGSRGGAGGLSA